MEQKKSSKQRSRHDKHIHCRRTRLKVGFVVILTAALMCFTLSMWLWKLGRQATRRRSVHVCTIQISELNWAYLAERRKSEGKAEAKNGHRRRWRHGTGWLQKKQEKKKLNTRGFSCSTPHQYFVFVRERRWFCFQPSSPELDRDDRFASSSKRSSMRAGICH